MRLAVLHHHLDPGGVTRVVEAHLRALATVPPEERAVEGPIVVLSGPRLGGWDGAAMASLDGLAVETGVVPELEYDDRTDFTGDAVLAAVAGRLAEAGCGPGETLLHVHNHSLGKSVAWSRAVGGLADRGYRLLLQTHDFAEDFRPELYRKLRDDLGDAFGATLYPVRPGVHYAALQARDRDALLTAGLPESRLHVLPNPVPDPPELPSRAEARRLAEERLGLPEYRPFWLYPVRGIRRKNLGELLLLSVLKPDVTFAVSLAPTNPVERPYFDRWRAFAGERGLSVLFDVGGKGGLTFPQNLDACDACVTTSVAEGFGMTFLEPWRLGRRLFGRDIPDITADAKERGLDLGGLYAELRVPLAAVGAEDFRSAFAREAGRIALAYGLPEPTEGEINTAFALKTAGGTVDFADLDEPLQERVIDRCREDEAVRGEILDKLGSKLDPSPGDDAVVAANAAVVVKKYSLAESGRLLTETYRAVADEPRPEAGMLLDRFVGLDRLRLVRGLMTVN